MRIRFLCVGIEGVVSLRVVETPPGVIEVFQA